MNSVGKLAFILALCAGALAQEAVTELSTDNGLVHEEIVVVPVTVTVTAGPAAAAAATPTPVAGGKSSSGAADAAGAGAAVPNLATTATTPAAAANAAPQTTAAPSSHSSASSASAADAGAGLGLGALENSFPGSSDSGSSDSSSSSSSSSGSDATPADSSPFGAITPAPISIGLGGGSSGAGNAGPGGMTIQVINQFTDGLYVSYGDNFGGPGAIGTPTAGALPLGSSTAVAYPTGWAGRIYVGPGPNVDPAGSKIEGSTTDAPDIDVSYVDGYSVPIVCSVDGIPQSGCNLDLFSMGTCDTEVDGVCHNPQQGVPDGPATPFFAPCVGAAYTFPNDNVANVGNLASGNVVCVIGTGIDAPTRQGHSANVATKRSAAPNKKRAVQTELQNAARQEQRMRARARSIMARA